MMKRIILIFITAVQSLGLCACAVPNPVISKLPEYEKREFYSSGGIQDYTDYAKYYWASLDAKTVLKTDCFKETTKDNIEEILLYIDNFEDWVETIGGELKENYDFNKSCIVEGNYFYIRTEYDLQDELAFANYSVYYYDVDANMIYYFHNNI